MNIEEISNSIQEIIESFEKGISEITGEEELYNFLASYIGKKGSLTGLIKKLGTLPKEVRPEAGKIINEAKNRIKQEGRKKHEEIRKLEIEKKSLEEFIDITIPPYPCNIGRLHPLMQTLEEIVEIFTHMGFDIAEGPEIETDWHNFTALGIPPEHPARQMQSTFFIEGRKEMVLRTHTSPVQIRRFLEGPPPIKIISPGVVYRHDDDPSHSPMFFQVEGLVVDDHTTFSDLKGTLKIFLEQMFGKKVPIRFRPSFFPFTEPSGEVDIRCPSCGGRESSEPCHICKGSGWTEILGCGQVDPVVLENVDICPEEFQGYAFGLGVDRIAMFKYGIGAIGLFYKNDLRFLRQFY